MKDVTTEFSDTMHIRDITSNVFSGLQKRSQKTENEPLANVDILTEERTLVNSAPDICFFSLVFRRQFVVIDENEPICTAKCVKDFDIEKTLDISGHIQGTPSDTKHRLHAILCHSGYDVDRGHFTCYIKRGTAWYYHEDEKVSKTTFREVKKPVVVLKKQVMYWFT